VDFPLRWDCWLKQANSCNSITSITVDEAFLNDVREGYKHDKFCHKLEKVSNGMPDVHKINDLWYLGDRLVIPQYSHLREDLFHLAHDSLGHFGIDKSYANIWHCYYWPNMQQDLKTAYVPACNECQQNKSSTSKAKGPLHPLPITEKHGDSVCLDFM
jgi:hypothetical protein